MMFLFLFLIFAAVAAALWFQGFWSGIVTMINLILAMMIATNFFEPVATAIEGFGAASWTYLLDFIVLWGLFGFAFGLLRAITDMVSQTQVKFDLPLEMGGRSLMALVCGWLMVCFTAFTMQMAPLNTPTPLGAWSSPSSHTFLAVSPERLWLRFMYSRSKGALAGQTFDPNGEFALKYHDRRQKFFELPAMRQ
jgi:hypothetical protein